MQAKETQPQNLVNQTAKEKKLKEISRLFVEEAWHKGNLNSVDEHLTDDFVCHMPPYPDKDKEAYKQYITDTRSSYPDVHLTIDEIIVEGDTIVTRYTFRGTQTGPSPVLGTPPTGKKITITGCTVAHSVDGKTVEMWAYTDWLSLMQQLGFKVVPPQQEDEIVNKTEELERRRNLVINITPEDKINLDNYVGTWKTCSFSRGIGTDKWWDNVTFENSTIRYLQFFPNGDLWVTGDWTRQEGWPFDQRNVATVTTLHSWDGTDTAQMYGKVDHPEKRDFRLIKQDDKLYFSWMEDTYYVLEKVSDNPDIKIIK